MLALEIRSLKNFMSSLLSGDAFDSFLLEEATISTANNYTIDGHINAEFFPPEERGEDHLPYAFQPWSEIKGMCFNLIKGKHTPLYFKFIMQLKPESADALLRSQNIEDLSQLKALVLSIRYDNGKAVLTTGTSYHTFVLNKDVDKIWDNAFLKFLNDKGIDYENLTSSS